MIYVIFKINEVKSNQIVNKSYRLSIKKINRSFEIFIQKLEFSYFGLISMTILIGSIIGGIAASAVLENKAPIWELGLVAAVSMANNTVCIAQGSTKWVFNLFILSIITNVVLILVNL